MVPQEGVRQWAPISQEEGYAVYNDDHDLFKGAVEESKASFEKTDQRTIRKQNMVSIETGALTLDNPLIKLALYPPLVQTVSNYLGMVPVLYKVSLFYSENESWTDSSSQFYHRDHDDVTQVKAILFISDVTEDAGPLTVVPRKPSTMASKAINYKPKGSRVEDDKMRQLVGGNNIKPLLGPAGTMTLVDTSRCFHLGSRPGRDSRLALFIQYVTPFAFRFPFYGKEPVLFPDLCKPDDPSWKKLLLPRYVDTKH